MEETIEVRYKEILEDSGIYHKYIVYTDKNGIEYYGRGGPANGSENGSSGEGGSSGGGSIPLGDIVTDYGDYVDGTLDWDLYDDDPRETIATGDDLSGAWNDIVENLDAIENAHLPYRPVTQNSNSTVDEALESAGLNQPVNDGLGGSWSPGSGKNLGGFDVPGGSWAPDLGAYGMRNKTPDLNMLNLKNDFGANDDNSLINVPLYGYRDPLVLDLDGDGIETISLADTNAFFDLDGNGFSERTGWISKDDGILVLDRNNNGRIEDVSEVFGSETVNGFEVLKVLDSNADGSIDAGDLQFNELKIWQDGNENGLVETGELRTLEEHSIQSINLNYSNTNEDNNGNVISQTSSYTRTDGSQGIAADANLLTDSVTTVYNGDFTLDMETLSYPWLRGYGEVADLPIVESMDASLKTLIAEVSSITSSHEMYGRMDELIAKWTGYGDQSMNDMRGTVERWKIEAIEKFLGVNYVARIGQVGNADLSGFNSSDIMEMTVEQLMAAVEQLPDYGQLVGYYTVIVPTSGLPYSTVTTTDVQDADKQWMADIYNNIKDKMYVNFVAQTDIGAALGVYYDFWDDEVISYGTLFYDNFNNSLLNSETSFAALLTSRALYESGQLDIVRFESTLSSNPVGNLIIDYTKGTSDILNITSVFGLSAAGNCVVVGGTDDNTIVGNESNNLMYGNAGDDNLFGEAGNDILFGEAGNDYLDGSNGNDILDGGTGNDYMAGGSGNDTYKFEIGGGQDSIDDYDPTSGNIDTVEFKAGITLDNVEFMYQNGTLTIGIKGTTDALTINGWFWGDAYRIEQFKFSDGTIITPADIETMGYKVYGTSEDDYLDGTNVKDFMEGGAGNDYLSGNDGVDSLDGGTGNDYMAGGSGSDTYKFGIGSGQDTIDDYDPTAGNIDTVEFGAGITKDNVEFMYQNGTLSIGITGTSDVLTINGWFWGDAYRIEQFKFADGTIITPADIETMGYKVYGTSGDDYLSGTTTKDIIDGGAGNDIMDGGSGSDIYRFNIGSGQDTFSDYDSTGVDIDIVEFGTGITMDDLDFMYQNGTLTVGIKGTTDSLTIDNWFAGDAYRIEQFKFADGSVVSSGDIETMGYKVYGTSGDDYLNGTTVKEVIDGGAGNDYLYGNNGSDTLDGGAGNDYLDGGEGGDTYKFGIGSGQDTISQYDWQGTDTDTVKLGSGITKNDLIITRQDYNLIIGINGTSDSLTIENWYAGDMYKLDSLTFEDGFTISMNDIESLAAIRGTDGDDYIYGFETDDILKGGDGNDILSGGGGSDQLFGGAGNDTYRFGYGSGKVVMDEDGGSGIDTLEFEAGVTPSELSLYKEGNDLTVKITGTSDCLTIKSWFLDSAHRPELIKFSDGSVYETETVRGSLAYNVNGTLNNDVLDGSSVKDTIQGYAGDDVIHGFQGDDILVGGAGNDLYIFEKGCGLDVVSDNGGIDTIQFATNPLDLIFAKSGDSLSIYAAGTNGGYDRVNVSNWYAGSNYQTEIIKTANGEALLNTQVDQLIQAMATFSADNGMTWSQALQNKPTEVQTVLAQYWAPQV